MQPGRHPGSKEGILGSCSVVRKIMSVPCGAVSSDRSQMQPLLYGRLSFSAENSLPPSQTSSKTFSRYCGSLRLKQGEKGGKKAFPLPHPFSSPSQISPGCGGGMPAPLPARGAPCPPRRPRLAASPPPTMGSLVQVSGGRRGRGRGRSLRPGGGASPPPSLGRVSLPGRGEPGEPGSEGIPLPQAVPGAGGLGDEAGPPWPGSARFCRKRQRKHNAGSKRAGGSSPALREGPPELGLPGGAVSTEKGRGGRGWRTREGRDGTGWQGGTAPGTGTGNSWRLGPPPRPPNLVPLRFSSPLRRSGCGSREAQPALPRVPRASCPSCPHPWQVFTAPPQPPRSPSECRNRRPRLGCFLLHPFPPPPASIWCLRALICLAPGGSHVRGSAPKASAPGGQRPGGASASAASGLGLRCRPPSSAGMETSWFHARTCLP